MSKKIYNLGKVKGRTPEFRLTEKILEIKYDDENTWSTLVDFSTIASSFDLRLNEETYFLEAQREVDGEWEPMVDLSALKLAHSHSNKDILDKLTDELFMSVGDTIAKKHKHSNLNILEGITEYDVENITDIPIIEEEVSALVEDVDALTEDVNELARNQGRYNEIDTEGKYAHIIGNGTDDNNRSNAHTIDWKGNAWYARSVSVPEIASDFISFKIPTFTNTNLIISYIFESNFHSAIIGTNLLSPYQYYLVTYDDADQYLCRCIPSYNNYALKCIDYPEMSIYQDDLGMVNATNRYYGDGEQHTLSISLLKSQKADLLEYINKIKEEVPTKTSELENDSGFITIDDVPTGSAGINVVDTVNDLPTDAKQNDVVFVENEVLIEHVEQIEKLPIEIKVQYQLLDIELKQDTVYLSDVDLTEKHPELEGEDVAMKIEFRLDAPEGKEIDVMYVHKSASNMLSDFGVNHSADLYMITTDIGNAVETRWIKIRGMSAKDFALHVAGLTLPDALMQVVLGDYYTDATADAPSYDWIKMQITTEPVNENSVDIGSTYVTCEFNAVADFNSTCILYIGDIEAYDENGNKVVDEYHYYTNEKASDTEQAVACEYANTFLNLLFYGGTHDTSYDVYSKKGFYKFDNGWENIEDETYIPKIVDKYSDLPTLFIENGIMAVANEEVIETESTNKLSLVTPVLIKLNPAPSVKDEIESLQQYLKQVRPDGNFAYLDENLAYIYLTFKDENDERTTYITLAKDYVCNGEHTGIGGVSIVTYTSDGNDRAYFCSDEPEGKFSIAGGVVTANEGGCWYYVKTNKNGVPVSSPQKVETEDWITLSNIMMYCNRLDISYVTTSGGYTTYNPFSYEFANLFKFDDAKPVVYPKGFYKYTENNWQHQPGITGDKVGITPEQLALLEANTEARHTHDNKDLLDTIGYADGGGILLCGAKLVTHRDAENFVYLDNFESTIDEVNNRIDSLEGATTIPKIETTATETTVLEANKSYSFGAVDSLTLEFAEGDEKTVNEYMFSFTSGATPTVLTLPAAVKWANELTIEANKRYEISIVDNIGLWCVVDIEAVSE